MNTKQISNEYITNNKTERKTLISRGIVPKKLAPVEDIKKIERKVELEKKESLKMPKKRVRPHVNPLSILKEVSFEGFGNDRPIFVDVGAFRGEFMAELSEIFPDHNFVCFEIRAFIAQKLREKFKDKKNFSVFDGDAGKNFRSILAPCIKQGAKIEKIFINFPDPWFKEKHKKRRFIRESFLNEVSCWLPAETHFVFQTDQAFLFQETLEYLKNTGYQNQKIFASPPFGIQTDWEKAKTAENQEIFRIEFWRNLC